MISLDSCLAKSMATPEFQADVRAYADYKEAPRIVVVRAAPRVKVLRVIAQLVATHPDLPVDRVRIQAVSGCADYRGTVTAEISQAHARAFEFVWNCSWRAAHEGWVDSRGAPDQVRAAREFGWQCFESWVEVSDGKDGGQGVAAQAGA